MAILQEARNSKNFASCIWCGHASSRVFGEVTMSMIIVVLPETLTGIRSVN
jgi:hypothetical protein